MPANALDHIIIQGFKSIANLKVDLRPINLLIGPNGSGKSNFIGVFAFLHAIREGRLAEYVRVAGGAERTLHFGSKNTKEILLDLSFAHETNQYQLKLSPSADDGLVPIGEVVRFWDKKNYKSPLWHSLPAREQGREAGISDPKSQRIARYVRQHLGRWRLYHVHDTSTSSPMRKTSKLHDNGFLRVDGSNLAAFLFLLKERYQQSYGLIRVDRTAGSAIFRRL